VKKNLPNLTAYAVHYLEEVDKPCDFCRKEMKSGYLIEHTGCVYCSKCYLRWQECADCYRGDKLIIRRGENGTRRFAASRRLGQDSYTGMGQKGIGNGAWHSGGDGGKGLHSNDRGGPGSL